MYVSIQTTITSTNTIIFQNRNGLRWIKGDSFNSLSIFWLGVDKS